MRPSINKNLNFQNLEACYLCFCKNNNNNNNNNNDDDDDNIKW